MNRTAKTSISRFIRLTTQILFSKLAPSYSDSTRIQLRLPTTFAPSFLPVSMHVLTLLVIHSSFTPQLSSIPLHNLPSLYPRKKTNTCQLSTFSMPAPERLTVTEDSKLYNHRWAPLKSLLRTTDPPRMLLHVILPLACIMPPYFRFAFSLLTVILLISLRKLKPSGENTYALPQHLPTVCICAGHVVSPIAVEEWPCSLKLSLPIFSGIRSQQFCALFHCIKAPLSTRIIPGQMHAFISPILKHTPFLSPYLPILLPYFKSKSDGRGVLYSAPSHHILPPPPPLPHLVGCDLLDASPVYPTMSSLL